MQELQQLLILERKSVVTSDEGAEIASMQSKISDLESQLQVALQKSDALKRALESKKRFRLINGYIPVFSPYEVLFMT